MTPLHIYSNDKQQSIMRRLSSKLYRYRIDIMYTLFIVIILYILFHFIISLIQYQRENNSTNSMYLYYNSNDSYPIIEHILKDNDDHNNNLYPYFLSDNAMKDTNVIVEFYAHWCYHCQHFRSHYIDIGRQMTELLLSTNHTERISFYAISCVVHNQLCNRYNIDGYPTIILYPKNKQLYNQTSMYAHQFNINEIIKRFHLSSINMNRLKEIQDSTLFQSSSSSSSSLLKRSSFLSKQLKTTNMKKQKITRWPIKTKQQIYYDIYLSFEYTLRNSIYTSNQPLDGMKQLALRNWLLLLQKVLPNNWIQMKHTIIDSLLQNWDKIIINETNLIHILDSNPNPYINTTNNNQFQWSTACSKGQIGMGYTCGLWQLLHIITVGVVEYNIVHSNQIIYNNYNENNNINQSTIIITTESVAEIIKEFITNFFQCKECRDHFLKDYNECSYQRCQRLYNNNHNNYQSLSLYHWIQLPIWLIETHNGVNVRLYHEENDNNNQQKQIITIQQDDDDMNQLWPSQLDCSNCYIELHNGTSYQLNYFNMYQYVKYEYWPDEDDTEAISENEYNNMMMISSSSSSSSSFYFVNYMLQICCFLVVIIIMISFRWHCIGTHKDRYQKYQSHSFLGIGSLFNRNKKVRV